MSFPMVGQNGTAQQRTCAAILHVIMIIIIAIAIIIIIITIIITVIISINIQHLTSSNIIRKLKNESIAQGQAQ